MFHLNSPSDGPVDGCIIGSDAANARGWGADLAAERMNRLPKCRGKRSLATQTSIKGVQFLDQLVGGSQAGKLAPPNGEAGMLQLGPQGGDTVGNRGYLVVTVGRRHQRGIHTDIGHHTCDEQVANFQAAQRQIKIVGGKAKDVITRLNVEDADGNTILSLESD